MRFIGIALTLAFALACRQNESMAGSWLACFSRGVTDSQTTCGTVTVADTTLPGEAGQVYLLTHTVPLVAILPAGSALDTGSFGSLRRREGDDEWNLTLGTPQGVIYMSGAPTAPLSRHGDTLSGRWERICFSGCPGNGNAFMVRRGAS